MENNQLSLTESQTSGTSENTTSSQTNLLQTYIKAHEMQSSSQSSEELTRSGKHDASGHCQQIVHVPAHTRQGHPVAAYDRLCGQKHTAKEAEQKNQEEAEEKDVQEQLLNKSADFIGNHEEFISHPYFDTNGNLTIGYGTVIYNKEEFVSLNLQDKGIALTKTQKEINYETAMSFKEKYSANVFAKKQENMKSLGRISETDARLMLENHIQNISIPNIKNTLEKDGINFDDLKTSVKIALIDLDYNTGSVLGFPNLRGALKNNDYVTMAKESHRYQVGNHRNKQVYDLIINALHN